MAGSFSLGGNGRTSKWRKRIAISAVAVSLLVAGSILLLQTRSDRPSVPEMTITIESQQVTVPVATTLASVIGTYDLHPEPGKLVDVTGAILKRQADPGALLVDGVAAIASRVLLNGDVIEVQDGTDRTEPVRTTRTELPGYRAGDPQFTVSTWRITKVTHFGQISGKVLGTQYIPKGKGRTPKVVALTFDDGPWPGSTARILRILRRYRVKATFFVIGNLAERRPQLVRKEEHDGMLVENHSWDHPVTPPFDELAPVHIESEMSMTNDALEGLGLSPTLFRPPGGSYDPAEIAMADRAGLRIVLWSVDPRDWEPGATRHAIVKSVLGHVHAGSIVELHDGGGDRSATIAALPDIIKGIRKRGLKLVMLG
ncbi:MAG: polysaccharide deacetylase family protein [Actinomycetota bacterium]|nr:polysaccharide deacetylase family protein [Actinomycetota bacterium]